MKTEYLKADIDEEIFIQQPGGFEKYNEQRNPLVCKLNESLYGLEQSGRNWYFTIKGFLDLGFVPSVQDECFFIKKGDDIKGMICLWVDDMVILRTRQNFAKTSKKSQWEIQISSYGDLS